MAIKEIRREWSACQLGYVCEFMLHTEADVKDLPICCVGSVAHVSETNTDYVCDGGSWIPRNEVKEQPGSAAGGGGGVGMLTVEVEVRMDDIANGTITYHSHSGKEIIAAHEAGMQVRVLAQVDVYTGGATLIMPLAVVSGQGNAGSMVLFASQNMTLSVAFTADAEQWMLQVEE